MSKFYEKVAYRDVEEDIKSQKSADKWIFGLLLIIIGFVPLIVMASVIEVQSPLITNVSALTGGAKGDLFTHYKALTIFIITILAVGMFVAKILFMNGEIRKTKLNYAIGAFAVAIVLSTIFSPNISIALHGQYNRADGAISWLCYLALFFIAMNIEYPKKVLNYILYALYPFVIINLFIITMNFYGNDLLQKAVVKKLVMLFLPAGANLSEGSMLVGTLNQWNYMSGMFAIMTVLFLTAAVLERSIGRAIGHLLIAIMSIAIVLMSISTSGFLTFCVMMFVILLAAFKSEKKVQSLAMVAVFLVATAPIFHVLANEDERVWTESIGVVLKSNPYVKEEPTPITSMRNNIKFDWMAEAYAAEGFELPQLPERGLSAGTGRIYIWEKALSLVKERPLLGYGMDTFMYNFPHYNIDARAGILDENTITDKSHSIYVSWLYGTGILGFISVIVLLTITLFRPIKLALKSNNSTIWVLWIAWGAYLIQALFNDSLPGVSAPMWAIAGILLSVSMDKKLI
ncbi:O-antigen ligase family protein [Lysinibacillus capsici]|uniref:O-antigen ligase family protein n=1 Tax=Lysinibacillus capsici TaxID=2115968 RepID=UPI0028BE07F2|nr:O-antigen ligase family protein [Lysinibacillus capsici]WNN76869.1 O-antigen ligase family protein [Lysinibacillus capsici]WPK06046.1 O-antigen ligase family protein [Lysinibacillus capsici]